MAEEPLDGLAVGFVAELSGQLEDSSGAYDRHADSPPSPVDFAVSVLGRRFLDGVKRSFVDYDAVSHCSVVVLHGESVGDMVLSISLSRRRRSLRGKMI